MALSRPNKPVKDVISHRLSNSSKIHWKVSTVSLLKPGSLRLRDKTATTTSAEDDSLPECLRSSQHIIQLELPYVPCIA